MVTVRSWKATVHVLVYHFPLHTTPSKLTQAATLIEELASVLSHVEQCHTQTSTQCRTQESTLQEHGLAIERLQSVLSLLLFCVVKG